jgi:hypothetical protein
VSIVSWGKSPYFALTIHSETILVAPSIKSILSR